jgi:hypothetical protein
MLWLLVSLYGGAAEYGRDRYGPDRYGVDESAGYGGEEDDPYLSRLFDGADSYIDMVLGGEAGDGRSDQEEPYDGGNGDGAGGYGADRDGAGYGGGRTVITVVYEGMYEPVYDIFRL